MAPKTAQDRPKTSPRSSWIGFLTLEFSLRFWIVSGFVLGPIWPPKWLSRGARIAVLRPLGGSKTVLKSSWFGSLVVLSFGIPFLVVLASSWGRFWPLRGSFWCFFRHFNSSIQPINSSTRRFNPSTHQPIDSTHQLIKSRVLEFYTEGR